MDAVKSSKPYLDGARNVVQASQGKVLSAKEFTQVRDYLLAKFSMTTGTRPGPLNNAIVDDYTTADSDNGKRIMLVPKHKRSKDGPAMLGMKPDLQGYLRKIHQTTLRQARGKETFHQGRRLWIQGRHYRETSERVFCKIRSNR